MIKIYVNEEKRTIVAVLQLEENGRQFKGKAVCSTDDEWNEEIGIKVAKNRALIAYKVAVISELCDLKYKLIAAVDACDESLEKNRLRLATLKQQIIEVCHD